MHSLIPILNQSFLLIFLISSMLGIGLAISLRAMVSALPRPWSLMVLLLVNFVLSPVLAYLIHFIIPLERPYATGLLLLGGAAGAPFLPKLAEVAGADLALSATLMTLLTVVTTLYLPFAQPLLLAGVAPSPWKIVTPMVSFILAPLAIGMFTKYRNPTWAAKYQPIFSKIANLAALLLIVTLVSSNLHQMLSLLGSGALAASALFTLVLMVVGYFTGEGTANHRNVYGLAAGARNIGAALVVANGMGDSRVILMLLASTLVSVGLLLPAAVWFRRRSHPVKHDAPTQI